jgi:hypothetical protein
VLVAFVVGIVASLVVDRRERGDQRAGEATT